MNLKKIIKLPLKFKKAYDLILDNHLVPGDSEIEVVPNYVYSKIYIKVNSQKKISCSLRVPLLSNTLKSLNFYAIYRNPVVDHDKKEVRVTLSGITSLCFWKGIQKNPLNIDSTGGPETDKTKLYLYFNKGSRATRTEKKVVREAVDGALRQFKSENKKNALDVAAQLRSVLSNKLADRIQRHISEKIRDRPSLVKNIRVYQYHIR